MPDRGIKIEGLYPNPFVGTINFDYKTERSGNLDIWLTPHTSGGDDILLATEYVSGAGTYTKSIDTNNPRQGAYYLVLEFDGELVSQTLIKL